MQSTHDVGLNPADLVRLLRTHVGLWAIPAVACAVLAAAYAFVAPREWRAVQALVIRADAASVSDHHVGKFSDLSEMKTLQETILELSRSRGVVERALREVGPPTARRRTADWPTLQDIDDLRKQIDMRPPGGAEFGKTEVFYLSVSDTNRERAGRLVAALCGQLESRLRQLRDERAQGMVAELVRTVAIADEDLAGATKKLSTFETVIGADLAELRHLNATVGGQGEVSQQLQAIEAERRANEAQQRECVQLLVLLKEAQADPQRLIATPHSLLRSQPAVSRLKDALVDAQVRKATLLGSRTENHPHVIAAMEAEELIKEQVHGEISHAIEGAAVDLALCADREQALLASWFAARERLSRLAEARAEYANLVASVESRSKLVEAARKNLADARARQAGAASVSVIHRIDGVDTGVRPVGPSRTSITAAGGVGGLLLGLGLVFLVASPTVANGEAAVGASQVAAGSSHDCAHHRSRNGDGRRDETGALPTLEEVLHGRPACHDREADENSQTTSSANQSFGLFRSMTLEDVFRSVEGRQSNRKRR